MSNPYIGRPDYQFWKRAGGIEDPLSFDPVTAPSFSITRSDAVVTAGSCFAQHVSRHLMANGFNVLITERAHPLISDRHAADFFYGVFSARYGNIYTARQLKQLLQRAYGEFTPQESAWSHKGRWVDAFRPQIQPGGYVSLTELEADREIHFAAIRRAIEEMSIFVFTLGLTEAWVNRADGAVYPLAPGVAGGKFDPEKHAFLNFTAAETAQDLLSALKYIRVRNSRVRFILTVSPVPLNATAVDRHVMVSTAYSKAALRVAAEEVSSRVPRADYFPSYEIITSPHAGGMYFAEDHRTVTEAGVSHVMRLFLKHYAAVNDSPLSGAPSKEDVLREAARRQIDEMSQVVQTLCDEEAINNE